MTGDEDLTRLAALVRTIPDFPQPGIQFRDITTLIADAEGFALATDLLAFRAARYRPDMLVAVEARGFIFAAAMARVMGLGVVLARKSGKLPGATIGIDYALEYGSDRLEMHAGMLSTGQRTVLVDDLLATGGTLLAAAELVGRAGAIAAAALCVIDLPDLGGSARLVYAGLPV
jgi:adenine phosphoribosyltransferase